MVNSYNDKLQIPDSEIIILGCPKINNLFILILIPRLKLLCLSTPFERYSRFNPVLKHHFLKKCWIRIYVNSCIIRWRPARSRRKP